MVAHLKGPGVAGGQGSLFRMGRNLQVSFSYYNRTHISTRSVSTDSLIHSLKILKILKDKFPEIYISNDEVTGTGHKKASETSLYIVFAIIIIFL